MSILLLIQAKTLVGWFTMVPKVIAGSLSPVWALAGLLGAVFGVISGTYWVVLIGILGAGIMTGYAWRCTRDHRAFEHAFGDGCQDQVTPEQASKMLKRRWQPYLKITAPADSTWERNVPVWMIQGIHRQLLNDL